MDKQSVAIMFRIGIIKAKKKIKAEQVKQEKIREEIKDANDFFRIPRTFKLKLELRRCKRNISQLEALVSKLKNALCCLKRGNSKPTIEIIEQELTNIEKTSITNQGYFRSTKTQKHIRTMHNMIKSLNC